MGSIVETPFDKRCEILGEFWIKYKADSQFADFILYNDLGLPLAYLISTSVIHKTPKAEMFVNETWDIFLSAMEVTDTGFATLDDLFDTEFPGTDIPGEGE